MTSKTGFGMVIEVLCHLACNREQHGSGWSYICDSGPPF